MEQDGNETETLNLAKILAKSMKNITKIKITKYWKFFKRKTLTIMSTSELPLNYVYIATCVHTIAVKWFFFESQSTSRLFVPH